MTNVFNILRNIVLYKHKEIMKTYIAFTKTGMIALLATNKLDAYNKVKSAGYQLSKSNICISSCNIDYVSCNKI